MLLPDREIIHKLLKGELAPEDAVSTVPNGTQASSGQPPEKPPDNSSGTASRPQAIGGFQILGILGKGGMGEVFLAEDLSLQRRVALKVMKPQHAISQELRDRFLLEGRAAARIQHDNVVEIYQVGIDDGTPFIAMPLLEGESLDDCLRREKVSSVPMLLKVGREVALGLQAAHDKKLIHRDIKPGNIWLEGDPKAETPALKFRRTKILDFGLARCLETSVHPTMSGMVLGSPLFMSPEQGYGRPTDARSDLFSLGVVLYCMATGEQPFKGESIMEVLMSLATHQPAAPKVLNPDLPDDVSELIVRLIRNEPGERYQSAREVVAEVERIIRALKAKSKSETSGTLPIPKTLETSKPEPLPVPRPIPAPVPRPIPVSERVVVSFPTEILPPTEPSLPTLEFDSPTKSRSMLWLGSVVAALVLLSFLTVTFYDNGPDSGSGSKKSRRSTSKLPNGGEPIPTPPLPTPTTPIATAPKPTQSVKIDPPVVIAPIAGEEKLFEIAADLKMKFCWIPAGEAELGSPKEEQEYLMKTQYDGKRPEWTSPKKVDSRLRVVY